MKAQLEWEASELDGGTVYAARDYFIYRYAIGPIATWRLEGHGLDVINTDIDELKRRAQADHDHRGRHVAWQRYMETYDPPDEDLLNNARLSWRLGDHREAFRYLFCALTGVNDEYVP